MKIFTSYFYKIRFFKPYQIPISTAIWDPKWYHENENQNHKYIDKNGVLNGLRYEALHPGPQDEEGCSGRVGCKFTPETCKFKREYHDQIFSLDKEKILADFDKICNFVKTKFNIKEEPEIILIVHEDPTNPCSERSILQEFFNCTELITSRS